MAVRTEMLGNSYYAELAGKFKNDKEFNELFMRLAEAEKSHIVVFTALREKLGHAEPEGWEEVSEYMRAYVESAFFLGKDKAMLHMRNTTEPMGAVLLAMGFEKETLLFFHTLRDAVTEKNILDEVIAEEKKHILWLSKLKEHYANK
jgi:rubrerythrin